MQILSYLGLKLLLMEDILSDFSDHNIILVKIKQGGEKYWNFGNFQDNDT